MIKIFLYTFFYFSILTFIGCSDNRINKSVLKEKELTPELLYLGAIEELDNQNFDQARVIFEKINIKYPLTNEAIQSQIMIGFISYLELNYEQAILKFDKIISNYPSHKNIDYVYYMRAISYYEQIEKETLDGNNNFQAIRNFEELIARFPTSKYTKDSRQKIIYVRENIAAKHMNIAFFYLKNNQYNAAIRRYQKIIEKYPQSKFTPEALFRLVEIYYKIGMIEDAKKTAAVISFNYPKSDWYKYSYELLNENKEDNKLINKLSNLFKFNDQK